MLESERIVFIVVKLLTHVDRLHHLLIARLCHLLVVGLGSSSSAAES